MIHQIGAIRFPLMRGEVPYHGPRIETIERRGRNEFIRRKTSVTSRLFRINTWENKINLGEARNQFLLYKTFRELPGQLFVKDDVDYTSQFNLAVVVLEVEEVARIQTAGIAGGLNPSSYGVNLQVQWSLRFVSLV